MCLQNNDEDGRICAAARFASLSIEEPTRNVDTKYMVETCPLPKMPNFGPPGVTRFTVLGPAGAPRGHALHVYKRTPFCNIFSLYWHETI